MWWESRECSGGETIPDSGQLFVKENSRIISESGKNCFEDYKNYFTFAPLKHGLVVQLVRMPPCHGGGREFESRPDRKSKAESPVSKNDTGLFLFRK